MTSTIGSQLRSWRKENSLTLAQTAKGTGYSVSYISDIERGVSNGSINALSQICAEYGHGLLELWTVAGEIQVSVPVAIAPLVDDYTFAIGQAGDLGGVEIL